MRVEAEATAGAATAAAWLSCSAQQYSVLSAQLCSSCCAAASATCGGLSQLQLHVSRRQCLAIPHLELRLDALLVVSGAACVFCTCMLSADWCCEGWYHVDLGPVCSARREETTHTETGRMHRAWKGDVCEGGIALAYLLLFVVVYIQPGCCSHGAAVLSNSLSCSAVWSHCR